MKLYIQNGFTPGTYKVEMRSSPDSNTVCLSPHSDIEVLTIEDYQPTITQNVQAVDGSGDPVFTTEQVETTDMNGNPITVDVQVPVWELDVNGDPITEEVPLGSPYKRAVIDADKVATKEAQVAQDLIDEKWTRMRLQRDRLLSSCDYIMMPDYPMQDKSAWEAYRQALRNLPDNITDIDSFVWPVKP
jgi:hypothetical protein